MSFTATALPEPYNSTLDRLFHGKNAFLEYNPGKCLFPESLKDYEDDILNLKVRPDDTFFFSYPRTGMFVIFLVGQSNNYYYTSFVRNMSYENDKRGKFCVKKFLENFTFLASQESGFCLCIVPRRK